MLLHKEGELVLVKFLSRHIGDAVVCNMNLENEVIHISKPPAEGICQRPLPFGEKGGKYHNSKSSEIPTPHVQLQHWFLWPLQGAMAKASKFSCLKHAQ